MINWSALTDPDTGELDIEKAPELVDAIAMDLLDAFDRESLQPESEQFFLLMLDSLKQAERFATLAVYKMRQAHAGGT